MRNYELMMLLHANLGDEETQNIIDRVTNTIQDRGELTDLDKKGIRRLAYEIEDEREAYYVVAKFKSEPDFPVSLERSLEINDNVLRYLVVRED